ncbi:hypothetical protein [Natranaerobius thermophilus]
MLQLQDLVHEILLIVIEMDAVLLWATGSKKTPYFDANKVFVVIPT